MERSILIQSWLKKRWLEFGDLFDVGSGLFKEVKVDKKASGFSIWANGVEESMDNLDNYGIPECKCSVSTWSCWSRGQSHLCWRNHLGCFGNHIVNKVAGVDSIMHGKQIEWEKKRIILWSRLLLYMWQTSFHREHC